MTSNSGLASEEEDHVNSLWAGSPRVDTWAQVKHLDVSFYTTWPKKTQRWWLLVAYTQQNIASMLEAICQEGSDVIGAIKDKRLTLDDGSREVEVGL